MDTETTHRKLLASAKAVLGNGYACYSGFRVAAAVLDEQGRIFEGVNVENASYGLTICAERSAIAAAVAHGAKRIVAIAVCSEQQSPIWPCGACRQVISEFAIETVPVVAESYSGEIVLKTVGELLPLAFRGPLKVHNPR